MTAASAGPRLWSALVIGGKRDGVSGPGVGATEKALQEDVFETGIRVTVGGISIVGVDVAGAHDVINRIRMKEQVRVSLS